MNLSTEHIMNARTQFTQKLDMAKLEEMFEQALLNVTIEDEYKYNLYYLVEHGLNNSKSHVHQDKFRKRYRSSLNGQSKNNPLQYGKSSNKSAGTCGKTDRTPQCNEEPTRDISIGSKLITSMDGVPGNKAMKKKRHTYKSSLYQLDLSRHSSTGKCRKWSHRTENISGIGAAVDKYPKNPFSASEKFIDSKVHPEQSAGIESGTAENRLKTLRGNTLFERDHFMFGTLPSIDIDRKLTYSQTSGAIMECGEYHEDCFSRTPSPIDQSHIPPVASRIQKFTDMIKAHDDFSTSERHYRSVSPCGIRSNHTNSINEEPTNRKLNGPLQRSSTFCGDTPYKPSQTTDVCHTCWKRIYQVDRISANDRVYHKACFRCATCLRTVLPGTYASLEGVVLCKPHYIEQFRRRGRYEVRQSFINCDDSEDSSLFSPCYDV